MSGVHFVQILKVIFLLSPFKKLHYSLIYLSILFVTFFTSAMCAKAQLVDFYDQKGSSPSDVSRYALYDRTMHIMCVYAHRYLHTS